MKIKLQNHSLLPKFNGKPKQIVIPDKQNSLVWSKPYKTWSIKEKINIVMLGQSGKIAIEKLCLREGISSSLFHSWSKELLSEPETLNKNDDICGNETQEFRFRIAIEGKSGETSVAEICKREGISHDLFLKWCQEFTKVRKQKYISKEDSKSCYLKNRLLIDKLSSLEVFDYIQNFVDLSSRRTVVSSNSESNKWNNLKSIEDIVVLQKINDVRFINKYFEKVNSKLEMDGFFIGCLETFSARKTRMKINRISIIRDIYFSLEFVIKRIFPKLSATKKFYFDFTKGNDRLLSKAEGLGRLVSCGFKIMDYKTINGLLYFIVKKVKDPEFNLNPSYGPVYKMPRLGKNGKIIGVYKLRTMHPYSEYIQDYVLNANGYAASGKPAEDFRIPIWGKLMRKFWLDELPQLLNVLKGDLKLVGIRPVSERYFQDIPKEMQKLRLTQKPGCIPPYVALNRDGNMMSVLQAEKDYLEEKIENPYTTDTKYFFKALINIVFKNKRSA